MDNATTCRDIDKIVERILNELNGVVAIYLFGSSVKGSHNDNSDYDIAVIVKNYPKNDIDIITKIRYSLTDDIKRPLDIVIIEINDLEYASPLIYEIFFNHELVFGFDILEESEVVIQNIRQMKPITADGVIIGYHV